ncbi:MAG: DUF6476 family protein [Pseudomonadota bacterium]
MSHPEPEEAGVQLVWLRRLVTVLTATMIGGVVLIVVLLVIRLNTAAPPLAVPDGLAAPDGPLAAVTFTPTRILLVDAEGMLHVHDRASGQLLQSIQID